MRLTRSSVVLAVVGVLLIVAAAVVRFVVVPSVTKLPDDLDVTLEFEGTYNGINPAALSGGATEVLAEDVPIVATPQRLGAGRRRRHRDRAPRRRAHRRRRRARGHRGLLRRRPRDRGGRPGPGGRRGRHRRRGPGLHPAGRPLDRRGHVRVLGPEHAAVRPGDLRGRGDLRRPRRLPLRVGVRGRAGRTRARWTCRPRCPRRRWRRSRPASTAWSPPSCWPRCPRCCPSLPAEIPIAWTSRTTTFVDADQELGATIAGGSTQEITGSLDLGVTTVDVPFATIDIYSTDDSIESRGDQVGDDSRLLNLVGTVLPIVAAGAGRAAARRGPAPGPAGGRPYRRRLRRTPL